MLLQTQPQSQDDSGSDSDGSMPLLNDDYSSDENDSDEAESEDGELEADGSDYLIGAILQRKGILALAALPIVGCTALPTNLLPCM